MILDYCEINIPILSGSVNIGVVFFDYDTLPFEVRIAYNLVHKLMCERELPIDALFQIEQIEVSVRELWKKCDCKKDKFKYTLCESPIDFVLLKKQDRQNGLLISERYETVKGRKLRNGEYTINGIDIFREIKRLYDVRDAIFYCVTGDGNPYFVNEANYLLFYFEYGSFTRIPYGFLFFDIQGKEIYEWADGSYGSVKLIEDEQKLRMELINEVKQKYGALTPENINKFKMCDTRHSQYSLRHTKIFEASDVVKDVDFAEDLIISPNFIQCIAKKYW